MKKLEQVNCNNLESLEALFADAPLAEESNQALAAGIPDLEADPEFVAEYLKGQFIEEVLKAMEAQGLNKNQLAQKLGKSRQYVGRVLNESANFTFETLAEFACVLGMRVNVRLFARDERLVVLPSVKKPRPSLLKDFVPETQGLETSGGDDGPKSCSLKNSSSGGCP